MILNFFNVSDHSIAVTLNVLVDDDTAQLVKDVAEGRHLVIRVFSDIGPHFFHVNSGIC